MQFDPATYLDVEISEPSVRRPPIPAGDYNAVIGEVKPEAWSGKPGGAAEGKTGMKYQVPLNLDLPAEVAAQVGLKEPILKLTDSVMLDLTDNGAIDNSPGKNGKLRRYRDALDMNKPGDVFSARKMMGRPVRVKISHELYQGEIMERIDSVSKI